MQGKKKTNEKVSRECLGKSQKKQEVLNIKILVLNHFKHQFKDTLPWKEVILLFPLDTCSSTLVQISWIFTMGFNTTTTNNNNFKTVNICTDAHSFSEGKWNIYCNLGKRSCASYFNVIHQGAILPMHFCFPHKGTSTVNHRIYDCWGRKERL